MLGEREVALDAKSLAEFDGHHRIDFTVESAPLIGKQLGTSEGYKQTSLKMVHQISFLPNEAA